MEKHCRPAHPHEIVALQPRRQKVERKPYSDKARDGVHVHSFKPGAVRECASIYSIPFLGIFLAFASADRRLDSTITPTDTI